MRGLHPFDDGVVDTTPNARLRTHDSGGNRLVDITDPVTGMCIGVRSPMTCNQKVIEQKNGTSQPTKYIRDIQEVDGLYVDMSDVVEIAQSGGNVRVGLVVRTCADGDDPLPISRVVVESPGMTRKAAAEAKRRKREEWEVKTVLSHMGWIGPVPAELHESTLAMIKAKKSQKSV